MFKTGICATAHMSSSVLIALLSLAIVSPAQQVQHYKQTPLVADTSGGAPATDANLVNPWGMSRSSGSPWWVSDNGTGLATLYTGTGTAVPLVVTIPTGDPKMSPTGTPTGQVFNGTQDFQLTNGKPAAFIFVTEDGTVSGWNGGPSAEIKVNNKSASVFKGAALATINDPKSGATNYLYVADFRKGRVHVYDKNFHLISLGKKHSATIMYAPVTHPSTSRTSAATSTSPMPSRTARSTMKSMARALVTLTCIHPGASHQSSRTWMVVQWPLGNSRLQPISEPTATTS